MIAGSNCYREHAGLVLAFLRSRVRAATSDDLSQQVWLKVWSHATSYFDGRNCRVWVFQVARNVLVDIIGSQSKLQSSPLPQATVSEGEDSENPRTAALRECLTKISKEFIQVVTARMLGEPYEAICEPLAIPIGTVHSRFKKAKQ